MIVVATLAAAALLPMTSAAQPNPASILPAIPTPPTNNVSAPFATENFIQQVATWASSFDTNKSWTPVKIQIEDGYKQATGSGASDYLRLQYNISGNFFVAAEGDFLGVGSDFTAFHAGGGYTLINKYDFKLDAELMGGYDHDNGVEITPELKAYKMMTSTTYLTVGLGEPIQIKVRSSRKWTPEVTVGAGFWF